VSCCTVWLKTLNLAVMEGTPQYIHLFLLSCFFTFIFIFILFSSITFVFPFQRQKGYFSSSLGVCYEPCQSRQFSNSQSRLALSMYLHIGDNVQIKFGGMGTQVHTPCLV
jgi:hypothetical protein